MWCIRVANIKPHKCKPNAKNVPVELNLKYFKTNLVATSLDVKLKINCTKLLVYFVCNQYTHSCATNINMGSWSQAQL